MLTARIECFADYSARAAQRWRSHREYICKLKNVHAAVIADTVRRANCPQYMEYVVIASRRWRTYKNGVRSCIRFKCEFVLGSETCSRGGIFDVRRDRWLRSRSRGIKQSLFGSNDVVDKIDTIEQGGIPDDIVARNRSRYSAYKTGSSSSGWYDTVQTNQKVIFKHSIACGECLEARTKIDGNLALYSNRARRNFHSGAPSLLPLAAEKSCCLRQPAVNRPHGRNSISAKHLQCSEIDPLRPSLEISYHGMPDEIYRRKAAKRYVAWKKKVRELESEKQSAIVFAEQEMKRRRGHDLLLSTRISTQRDFAPFLFENSNTCFAFSSKISQKAALCESMVKKYSSSEEPKQTALVASALHVANTKQLFHSKVMNRFH